MFFNQRRGGGWLVSPTVLGLKGLRVLLKIFKWKDVEKLFNSFKFRKKLIFNILMTSPDLGDQFG